MSRDDFARRYGAFLGFLQRTGRLERDAAAAAQVTLPNVEAYIADLTARVRSVTVYNCIYKLRRAAELLAPTVDFSWLAEIEKDLALVMEPRSKFDRLVFTERLVEAGLTLVAEAQEFADNDLASRPRRAQRPHDRTPRTLPDPAEEFCRLGDWADVQGGSRELVDRLAGHQHEISPARRASRPSIAEPLHRRLSKSIAARSASVKAARPTPSGSPPQPASRMTTKNLGTLVSKITLETLGVDVSPHLFRTAAASTAAAYGGKLRILPVPCSTTPIPV